MVREAIHGGFNFKTKKKSGLERIAFGGERDKRGNIKMKANKRGNTLGPIHILIALFRSRDIKYYMQALHYIISSMSNCHLLLAPPLSTDSNAECSF